MVMKQFFRWSLLYLLASMVIFFAYRQAPFVQIVDAFAGTADTLLALIKSAPGLVLSCLTGAALIVTLIVTWAARKRYRRDVVQEVGWALFGCLVFSIAFTFTKTSIPDIFPFYADPWLAKMDQALHGGVDAWIWAHQWSAHIPAAAVATLYFVIWGIPVALFPVVLALTDRDAARKVRFLILSASAWIGLGNVTALIGSSVGPVYYDRLLGGARFEGLLAALQSSGIAEGRVGQVQDGLWQMHLDSSPMFGAGISAFPSMHVALACVIMLYLCERSRWLAPLGVLFLLSIQFCSVYIGWHYAIDGYVSLFAVIALWIGLKVWFSSPDVRLGAANSRATGAPDVAASVAAE